jgi:ubiquinone/menaquinone biosynthesis C-methylase UbiE
MADDGKRKREENLRVFNQAAATYGRIGPAIFTYFGERLVDLLEIADGAHVLDVAAGRGALLFPAAAKVGSTGHVTAIDFSPDMVAETAKDIESQKLHHAEIRQMDAEQMNLPDVSFDRVVCGFALWMFDHPARVLQEFYRVMNRGARAGLSTWAADNPSQVWCHEVLRPYVPAPAAAKGDFRFDTPVELETALQQAGFVDIRITVEEKDFVYGSEEEYWLSLWSAGLRRRLEKATPAQLELAKSEVFRQLQTSKEPDGFHKVHRALFAFGTKRD